ncbi:DUF2147 domain-containing protein [Desertibaculum subflavum]|uniref:DUF2147 domain-containing protein n=1 Tax=Desertibaculum subflavum TaxID=2268458 RepID=UPI000E6633B5
MRRWILLLALLTWPAIGVGAPPMTPVGTWETPEGKGGKAHIRIEPCAGKLCGRIVWLEQPDDKKGQPKTDRRNSDIAQRARPILGLPILNGFLPDPERTDRWIDGRIYNPEDGETYKCTMTLGQDGMLDVRGYVGLPLLGKTQTWRRVE